MSLESMLERRDEMEYHQYYIKQLSTYSKVYPVGLSQLEKAHNELDYEIDRILYS